MTPTRAELVFGVDTFTITEDHVKLARRLHCRFEDSCEWGAPSADCKRPFGNGDLFGDMREILGREPAGEDGPEPDREELMTLYRELAKVLEITLRTGSLATGTYMATKYHSDWRRMRDDV